MAFEGLSEKLQGVFKKLKGKGVITEADVNEAMREVKLALLEADVNFKIVKDFVSTVKEKCLGADVLQSLTPAQQVIKIVDEELTAVMGGTNSKLTYSPKGFTVILLVGLQGTGKTTTAGKLASYLTKNGKKPMLAACVRQPSISWRSSRKRSAFPSIRTERKSVRKSSLRRRQKKRNTRAMMS